MPDALDPIEAAKRLVEHPGHEGCCPVCRQAVAESWANLDAIGRTVGAMLADPPPFMRMLMGGRKRGRGAGAPSTDDRGQEALAPAGGPGNESPPAYVQGIGSDPSRPGEPVAQWFPVNDLIHAHPDPEFPETNTQHAHVGGDAPHSHIVEGVSPDGHP